MKKKQSMQNDKLISDITNSLGDSILNVEVFQDKRRAYIEVEPRDMLIVGEYLYNELGCRLVTASAMRINSDFEIYYHFSHDRSGMLFNIHVSLPKDKPVIDSLANTCMAANWIEREMHELYGLEFRNHPKMEPLLSEGNWPEGEYPLQNGKMK